MTDGGPERAETWAIVTELLGETWPHPSGAFLGLAKLAIDTGYESPAVYAWARRMGVAQVVAIKDVEGFNRAAPVVGPTYVDATEAGRRIRRGAKLWTVAAATFKSETYRFLRLSPPIEDDAHPAGYVHLPCGVDAEWVKQLWWPSSWSRSRPDVASPLEWQKLRERNEALDCRVYARAAAWITGIDRWSERKWQELEKQLGIESPAISPAARSTSLDQHLPANPARERRGVSAARPAGWLGRRSRGWLRRR